MSDPVPIYTAELLSTFGETIAAYRRVHSGGIDPRRLANALFNSGIALVDRDRRSALIDERVYSSALERAHAADRRAPVHRLPAPAVWASLAKEVA